MVRESCGESKPTVCLRTGITADWALNDNLKLKLERMNQWFVNDNYTSLRFDIPCCSNDPPWFCPLYEPLLPPLLEEPWVSYWCDSLWLEPPEPFSHKYFKMHERYQYLISENVFYTWLRSILIAFWLLIWTTTAATTATTTATTALRLLLIS